MNKSESKYFNTAIKMDEAFLELLNQKDFEFITVKEICQKANVNRSTFYLHYETLNDILLEANDYICNKFADELNYPKDFDAKNINSLPLDKLLLVTPEYLMPWLSSTRKNKKLFQTIIKHFSILQLNKNYRRLFEEIVSPILNRFDITEEDREYIFVFYVDGVLNIVNKWIENGCDKDIADICRIIMECVGSHENKRANK